MTDIATLSARLGEALLARGWRLATAESCTGGAVAAAITDIAGSSQWFDRGFVTYSNRAKQEMLGVRAETLQRYGAVSEATVREMVSGAIARSGVETALAISGIAGPGGGTPEKPVGTVCFAWATACGGPLTRTVLLSGDRLAVRAASVVTALQGLLDEITRSRG